MVHINVWSPSLKVMITVLDMEQISRKPIKIQILGQEFLKLRILFSLERTPHIDVGAHFFFLTFLVF
jgi:hypothetical protein